VPGRVEVVADDQRRLQMMGDGHFNPRDVAYVEQPIALPSAVRGTVSISDEIPMRITLSLDMQTPGLVVLADLWDTGWKAYLNGTLVPILRTNHAIRGVVVPPGQGKLVFLYQPNSFTWGVRLAAFASLVLIVWFGLIYLRTRGYIPAFGAGSHGTPMDVVVK
jgi:uncharacterized membrane protein YfhO